MELDFLRYLESMRTEVLLKLFEAITLLGEEIILVLLIVVIYFTMDKKLGRKIFLIAVTSGCMNSVVKNFVKRPRPFMVGDITPVRVETATGYSFPSGHTQNLASWSTVIWTKYKKVWIGILALTGTILIAFSRMFLGVHYPSDVLAGAVLGIGIALFLNYVSEQLNDDKKLLLIIILCLLPFAIFYLANPDPEYEDFFKLYPMLPGFLLGMKVEERLAPLQYDVTVWKKILRVIIGVVCALVVKEGLKLPLDLGLTGALLLDAFRYFAMVFVIIGLCPILFKKIKL